MAAIRRVDYDKVEQMLREGAEVKEVASALGIHRQTICDGMKSRGVSIADMKFGLKFSPSERDVLYAAGIFDGEGSIGINRNRTPKGSYRWWLVVSVANIDMRLHIWLQATFGGHVRVNSRKNPARPCYHWTLTSRQAADFLKLLSPFLKIKGEQAAVGIEFQEAIHQSRDETGERAARLQLLKDHLETLR